MKASLKALRGMNDSQLETTLLRSCLALPKVAFVLRSCPPSHASNAASEFDAAIRETLRDIVGGPLSDWLWLKASLPCSRGGLGLRNASLQAPAAFLASSLHSQSLMERMLGHPPCTSSHTNSPAVAALAAAAARPDWQGLDDIDVSLCQRSLSLSIDDALHQHLISSAPSTRSRALALSTGLPHACDWLNVGPSSSLGLPIQDREFRCCLCYWLGVPLQSTMANLPALSAEAPLIPLVIIKLAVAVMEIVFLVTMPSGCGLQRSPVGSSDAFKGGP